MVDINHKIGINASPKTIYQALTTNEGLASWWTNDVSGAGEVGSVIKFRFNGNGPDFEVLELKPDSLVRWRHSGKMPPPWIGTEISFLLEADETQTLVRFKHSGWSESSDFMAHCNTKWGVFLLSLKNVLETGVGQPFPNDVQIDHS